MCYHSYSQDSKSLRAKVEGRQWRRESKHKAVRYSDGRSPTRRPSLLLCCTDISEKAIGTTEPQKNWSRGGWEKDLCSGPLLFPVQVSCTEQHLPLYSRVVFPSRWGSCPGSQISCPIASTSSEPGMAGGARALVRHSVRQGCLRSPHPQQAELAGDSKWPGFLPEQVAQAWGASGATWIGEMHKWVWCLTRPGPPASDHSFFIFQSLRMKQPLLKWAFHGNRFELSQLHLPGVTWQVTFSGISL